MLYFSAALLSRAFGPLIALFASPCGRHSSVGGRRRRSTRVRRYAPVPAPVEATAPPVRTDRTSEVPKLPAPRLAPPSERFPAEDIALVRPYYAVHERFRASENPVSAPRVPAPRRAELETIEVQRGFDHVKARAAALLQQWRDDPSGDLLGEPAPRFEVIRAKPTRYAEWDELTSATRAWLDQQQWHQRQGVPA